jgi:outer membrane immunogenic protein
MKRVVLATIAVATLVAPAIAADMPYPTKAAPQTVFSWTGFNGGVQGGYGWGKGNVVFPGDTTYIANPAGSFVGGYFGYNVQLSNNVVLGAETDMNWGSVSGSNTSSTDVTASSKVDWFSSVRLRLGYSIDRTLLFVTAGGTLAGVKHYLVGQPDDGVTFSDIYTGWTAGAGIEFAFTNNLTARIEYRYYDFGSGDYSLTNNILGYYWASHSFNATMQTVSAGLGYKF